jgi:precorrin-6B methylase 1
MPQIDDKTERTGSLVCVGTGMLLGGHLTPRARHEIEHADVVYGNLSDGLVERWVEELSRRFVSLQPHYQEGRSRMIGYEGMVNEMLDSARAGQRVCGAFYGHPGVFAWVPHEAIRRARAEGIPSRLEPGVSAEDCLYADLGLDPGDSGCQHYEATQFLLHQRRFDPAALLVLWQIGIVGDRSLARFSTGPAQRALLVEVLQRDYPAEHRVCLYRAATFPLEQPQMRWLALHELPAADVDLADTLVVPPGRALMPDSEMRRRLKALLQTR